jgi:lysophospholipase L1-like esterase
MKTVRAIFWPALPVALLVAATCRAQAPAATPSTPPAECVELPAVTAKLESANKTLSDWPNLSRYRQANAELPAADAKDKAHPRVVFMGDSITDIWFHPEFNVAFKDKPYVGRGIGGQTTPQMLIRFRPDVIALRPKVVVILAGTNDLAGNTGPMTVEETENNLASMSELAHANGIRVVLSSVLPVSNYGHDRAGNPIDMRIKRPPEKILEVNAWIKKYVAEKGYVYLDYFAATVDEQGLLKKDLSEDGLHPNAKGYEVMAPLAEQAIKTALKKGK